MEHKNYITLAGYERLQQELYTLVTHERPQLVQTINWAASNGDRSENADYIYGKRKLREVDRRIRQLTKKLEAAEAVDCSVHQGSETIYFGATVTILRNGEIEQEVKIVGQDEIAPNFNHISWTSPLAKALLRKNIGDTLTIILPGGKDTIEVIDITYQ
jgi:transcription elongation factor GreB